MGGGELAGGGPGVGQGAPPGGAGGRLKSLFPRPARPATSACNELLAIRRKIGFACTPFFTNLLPLQLI